MNTFKRKSLHAAVLAGLGAVGRTGTVSSVPPESTDLGTLVHYPYYTVRANENVPHYPVPTIVVAGQGGKRSAPVLDFNLYLSHADVWTGAIVHAPPMATNPA